MIVLRWKTLHDCDGHVQEWAGTLLDTLADLDVPCTIVTMLTPDHQDAVLDELEPWLGASPIYSVNWRHPDTPANEKHLIEVLEVDQATGYLDDTRHAIDAAEAAGVPLFGREHIYPDKRLVEGDQAEDLALDLASAYTPRQGGIV